MKKLSILGLLLILAISLSGCLVRDASSNHTLSNEEIAAESLINLEYFFRYNEFYKRKDKDDYGLEVADIMELFNDRKYDEAVVTISDHTGAKQRKDYDTLETELYEQKYLFGNQPNPYRIGVYYPMDREGKSEIEEQIWDQLEINIDLESILLIKDESELERELTDSEKLNRERLRNLKPEVLFETQSKSKVKVGFFVLEQAEDIGPLMTDWGEIYFEFINEGNGWLIDHVAINYEDGIGGLDNAPIDFNGLDDIFVNFPDWVNE
ncbi:hypothetical protein [Orenia marismortui]|uniref:hypothetical protein n=1 Tax=Orenia marismortui TaxID=46469 RepID=UPI00036DAB9C|nr:hypothetical protein [Orenia marismortui]